MANSIVSNSMIALEAIRLWKNQNALLNNVRQQYSKEFSATGAKKGYSIRIRQPVEYVVRTGPTAVIQDTVEKVSTLTVAQQAGVDMSFSSADRTMLDVDEFFREYVRSAVNTTAGAVATALMLGAEGASSGWSAAYDGSGNLLTPTMQTWLNAGAILDLRSVPTNDKMLVTHPLSQANSVSTFSNLFNSQARIAAQYESGDMVRALGFNWMTDNTTLVHTTGTLAASSTYTAGKGWSAGALNGANQTGAAITIATSAGGGNTFNKGDIVVFAATNSVNAITKQDTGSLATFTVTADVPSGSTSLPIYPPIVGPAAGPTLAAYQNVTALPAASAAIYSKAGPSSQYRKNLAFHPDAITLAIVDMEADLAGAKVARESQDGVSIRVATQWSGTTDQQMTRLDILYGLAYLRPEWIVVVADPVS